MRQILCKTRWGGDELRRENGGNGERKKSGWENEKIWILRCRFFVVTLHSNRRKIILTKMSSPKTIRIAIAIPVYRIPTPSEEVSLRQCCKVLGRYDTYLVAPDGLDTTPIHRIWAERGRTIGEERFAADYFKGLKGYNRLCLSRELYARFSRGGVFAYTYISSRCIHFCG